MYIGTEADWYRYITLHNCVLKALVSIEAFKVKRQGSVLHQPCDGATGSDGHDDHKLIL
jgi:hypothetical protein